MPLADKRVCLRKTAILQRNPASTALMELARQQAGVVEISESAIAVDQDVQFGRVNDPFDCVGELTPRYFIGIAAAQRARDR
ncbi:hypothetical protein J2R76_003705 [Bradyrhizobium sp. USDA 4532]|nr:hypothetical protein [Bradyrhizobium sp. USDA 4545]MCP1920114.1 hypothetical protein [Bradyrhizobium sp. USDA 4532]